MSQPELEDMRDHYDFSQGVRGKYAGRVKLPITVVEESTADAPKPSPPGEKKATT